MTSRRRVLLVTLAVVLGAALSALTACSSSSAPTTTAASPADQVAFQLNWFHEAEFVGYYVADAKGFYRASGLDVTILEGGPGDPAIDSVRDGRATFGVSSFGEQKEAVARGDDTVAVMAAFQIPPLVIFSLADSGIAEPADLAGRRVGVTTDYWKDILEETLRGAGVDPSTVREVKVDPEDLSPLYDGDVAAWLGYAQDEPIHAEMAGHSVTTMFPADYGVGGYEGLVLATRKTVVEDPGLVRRFVQASEKGWRYAVEHPDEAAQVLLDWAPKEGLEFQVAAVRAVGPLVDAPQAPIGWISEERWKTLMGAAYSAAHPGYTMSFTGSGR